MNEVLVYSVATDSWYRQNTTVEGGADYPAGRWLFCAVAATAPDGSSYNIYMYGGETDDDGTASSEMWILTIPFFHWIQVDVDSPPRKSHGCAIAGQYAMLTYGGVSTKGGDDLSENVCDNETYGLRLFGLSGLKWYTSYAGRPSAGRDPYTVPKAVYDVIGGWNHGEATKVIPDAGFGATELSSLFPESTRLSPKPSDTGDGKKANIGAIVGGIVGGIVGLIVIIGCIVFFLRRRSRRSSRNSQTYELK